MIVKMTKYTLVVLERERAAFLERLQELGAVDVTTTGWTPSADDQALMDEIQKLSDAASFLAGVEPAATSGDVGYDDFERARARIAELETEIAAERRVAAEVAPLGEFDAEKLRALVEAGVPLDSLGLVAGAAGTAGLPTRNARQVERHVEELETERADSELVIARAAGNVGQIRQQAEALKDRLQLGKAQGAGAAAVDGRLVVMEAWARAADTEKVEAALSDTLYIKARPTPEDETPVELRNGGFARPFEFIGNLYARPRYGRMDLTRWFAPFFMLFFGLCMADLGYGFLIFAGGLAATLRSRDEAVRSIGRLTMMCGGTAVVVGAAMGSAFGVSLGGWEIFAPVKRFFISSDRMFYIAIGIGIFQVMFAIVLRIVTTARAFGLRYALSDIGWVSVLVSCIVRFGAGVQGDWFLVALGLGVAAMLLFDSPGKNVFVNIGGGLYATFNRVTGLLSDALSYIRLFAIGLSGGVLAMVFNTIAMEVSPDIPVVGQLVTLVLLLFGHGLNLFMSTLSAVVHPLRLTFVEFFNNAGFEAAGRDFTPLKSNIKKQ